MKIQNAVCIPLVMHDPFFSVWSDKDHLYDGMPIHWSGKELPMKGWLTADDKTYSFLGQRFGREELPQVELSVTACATEYIFENEAVRLSLRFTSPIILSDRLLVSRPCTYVDLSIEKKTAKEVSFGFEVNAAMVRVGGDTVLGFEGSHEAYHYSYMGRVQQQPLNASGDAVTIDWGYAYLATEDREAKVWFDEREETIGVLGSFGTENKASLIFAYDDLLSINYFGEWKKAYWTKEYAMILDAIAAAFADKEETLKKVAEFDKEIEEAALRIGGRDYAYLCNMSYRQAVAGHKLICDDEGELIFLSKENDSNGCIGTVDISYPSLPLFMLYDTEYVKAMLRPIFKFASYPVWEFDYAPHDVGRYPYAWGQAYAYRFNFGEDAKEKALWKPTKGGVFPPFYMYPAGSGIYDERYQMPVEECGNMLIMTAAICKAESKGEFAKRYWETLKLWKNYLVEYGKDPGDQLCTDDFAGHLEHNANLSIKAIMGIYGYAMIAEFLEEPEEAKKHYALAKEMALEWEQRAKAKDHYVLAFGKEDSWSLKYNLVWDKLWDSGLFSKEVYEKELAYYLSKTLEYGTPLDSRGSLAKSDWILWIAAMAEDKAQFSAMIEPVAHYLETSSTRIPFGDWYMADTGTYCMFKARTVQGGIYMPMWLEYLKEKR